MLACEVLLPASASEANRHHAYVVPEQPDCLPQHDFQSLPWVVQVQVVKQEDEGDDTIENQENNIICLEEQHEQEKQSANEDVLPQEDRLLIADVEQQKEDDDDEDEDDEEEDDLEEGGQDVEECSSSLQSGKESQGKKSHGSPSRRKKNQEKMNHGKLWVMDNLLFVTTTVSVVSLSGIEKAYRNACHREGREPLTKFVLARLIHEQFPTAGKCRLGSRGHQKIHYSNLQWRVNSLPNKRPVTTTTSTALVNKAAGETPSKDVPPATIQGKGKKPASSVSRKDISQDPCPGKNAHETLNAAKEALVRATFQPLPEAEDGDEEGCENAAKRLTQVVKWVKSQGKWDVLLKTFAHSASCNRSPCCPLCLMFRRVRRHVVSARHACYVLRIYSVLLKLHVASCNDNNCGMTACPALRASRQMKRGRDDHLQGEDAQQEQQEEETQQIKKRVIKRPSSLRIRPLSPASSLPDSHPSTPSPPLSPIHTLPPSPSPSPSPFRIVPLPPLRPRFEGVILAEHGGA